MHRRSKLPPRRAGRKRPHASLPRDPSSRIRPVALAIFACFNGLVVGNALASDSHGGTPDHYPPVLHQRLNQEGVSGTLVIHGGGAPPADLRQAFLESLPADRPVVALRLTGPQPPSDAGRHWIEAAGGDVVAFDYPARSAADAEPLVTAIRQAGGVWIEGDGPPLEPNRPAAVLDRSPWQPRFEPAVMAELSALLHRRGVLGVSAWAASILATQTRGDRSLPDPRFDGLRPLSDTIIRSPFSLSRPDRLAALRDAVTEQPTRFGLGLDEATAAVVHGRQVVVVGEGMATIVLAAGPRRPLMEVDIPAGSAFDLTQVRRAGRWRGAAIDPGKPVLGPRRVDRGSLVIVGGGGMPQAVVDRFVSLAGGAEARIVVLPTAVPRAEAMRQRVPRFLAQADVAEVTMLPQSRTDEIEDERFVDALRRATGIWFDGGRQWHFVDAYENTPAVELFHDLLRRGGVIGGSSAGATIQGEYLVRGHPLGNRIMMAEGYERGFGFLPAVAIDQHFSQRGRHADLVPVIARHPELLGIGIDESTALVVTGSRAEVIGDFAVHFLASGDAPADADDAPSPTVPPFITVAAGEAIDLLTLRPLEPQPADD